jgi:hypothetical protein
VQLAVNKVLQILTGQMLCTLAILAVYHRLTTVAILEWEITAEHGTVTGYATAFTSNFARQEHRFLAAEAQFRDKFTTVGCVVVAGVFHTEQADKVL